MVSFASPFKDKTNPYNLTLSTPDSTPPINTGFADPFKIKADCEKYIDMFWPMGDFSVGTILCVILNNVDPGTAPRHVHRVRGRAADMNVISASCRRQDILTSIVYNLKDANPDFDPNTGWMSEIKMAADMCEHVRKELDKTSSKKE